MKVPASVRIRIAAALDALLMLGGIGVAIRWASPERASCSIRSLFGSEP